MAHTPKFVTESGAVTPATLDTLYGVVLTAGIVLPHIEVRGGSSPSGPIITVLKGSAANATLQVDFAGGIDVVGGVYVKYIAGDGEVTLDLHNN